MPYSLTNFEIQRYYQNESKFNGVYSINDLPKIKGGTYIINLNEYESVGAHWIPLYVNANNATYFNSFGVERISKEIKKFEWNKNIITNIYRMWEYSSIMCRYFCIRFIDFLLKGLLDYENLFSPNGYEKNDKAIPK